MNLLRELFKNVISNHLMNIAFRCMGTSKLFKIKKYYKINKCSSGIIHLIITNRTMHIDMVFQPEIGKVIFVDVEGFLRVV